VILVLLAVSAQQKYNLGAQANQTYVDFTVLITAINIISASST